MLFNAGQYSLHHAGANAYPAAYVSSHSQFFMTISIPFLYFIQFSNRFSRGEVARTMKHRIVLDSK